jgi:hypothetical protein
MLERQWWVTCRFGHLREDFSDAERIEPPLMDEELVCRLYEQT